MMARSHESTSALAWMCATAVAVHVTLPQAAAGLIVAAGAGLLPDLDLPQSSPSRAFPPVSTEVARCVHWAAAGHRQRTHTLVVTAAVMAAVWAAAGADRWWTISIVFVLAVFVARVLGPRRVHGMVASFAVGAAVTWAVWRWVPVGVWLPEAVGVGYLAHLLVDCLSVEGVPLLWPACSYRFRLPVVPVNSVREHLVGSASLLGAGWLGWLAIAPAVARIHG